jgi:hypothetical protein
MKVEHETKGRFYLPIFEQVTSLAFVEAFLSSLKNEAEQFLEPCN